MRQDASMAPMNGFGQEYPGGGKARSLLGTVLELYGPRDFAVQLWDGEQWPAQADIRPRFKHQVEFWRLWLDDSLSYSCAYFQSLGDSLAVAQQAKLDYICRFSLRQGSCERHRPI